MGLRGLNTGISAGAAYFEYKHEWRHSHRTFRPGIYRMTDRQDVTGISIGDGDDIIVPWGVMANAERAWAESASGEVTWLKNRLLDPASPVDMEEFVWIKLQAKPL